MTPTEGHNESGMDAVSSTISFCSRDHYGHNFESKANN